MFVGLRNVLLLLSVCLIFAADQAGAVALGKIEVTSRLGETFFAEAPLQLDAGEKISDVTVEMAAPSDYQILEVFRDPALSNLVVDIVNDLRGPRAVISSNGAVDTPYFNLVLKLRHGHATHFKKYPVFLDLPEQVRPAAVKPVEQAPVEQTRPAQIEPAQAESAQEAPTVSAVDVRPIESLPAYEPAPAVEVAQDEAITPTGSEFNPYDGWARTSRYGPMVRGDSITTVARRLRVDERYTLNQVMVGLFNKNKDKFRENNVNLINAGTYLNVPSATEVESIPASQAEAFIREQEQDWKNLRNQPVYAAEAEAQENRYRTRVHVGESASGTAAAPMQQDVQAQSDLAATNNQPLQQSDDAAQASGDPMRALQEENLRLQQALQESEARSANAAPVSADAAAAEEQVKKLELRIQRLQKQFELANQELEQVKSQNMNSLTYAMAGIILLLIAVAGYLLFLLRRDRPHPSMPDAANQPDAMPAVAAMAAPAVGSVMDDVDAGDTDTMDAEAFAQSPDSGSQQDADIEMPDDSLMFEQKAPKAQSGVDYLAEAEVYLRYGMDDEALQQMHLAIEQKPDSPQAHNKLVQFLQSRGDQVALTAAIEAARSALSGSDLQAFEASLLNGHFDAGAKEVAGAEALATDQSAGDGDINLNDTKFDDIMSMFDETSLEFGVEDTQQAGIGSSNALELDFDDMKASESVESDSDIDLSFDTSLSESVSEDEPSVSEATAKVVDQDGGLDFVSSIEISEASAEDAPAKETDATTGLDFASDDDTSDSDLSDVLKALASHEAQEDDDSGLSFGTGLENDGDGEDFDSATEISSSDDDDLGLDAILGEFGKDGDGVDAAGIDFSSAGNGVTSFNRDAEESVPETLIDGGFEDDLGIDDILGEFAIHDSDDMHAIESIASSDDANASIPETLIDADASDDDLGLDDILGQFDRYAADSDKLEADDSQEIADASSDIADMPEMDVSDELDDLLAEWGEEGSSLDFEAGPERLDLDRARSLLAENSLDEAELALQSALDGARRSDALIGLAEVAARRGDAARSSELLGEAESLLDDSNRDWFESVKNLSA